MNARQASSLSSARLAWLWFGILAAPLAWSAQELVSYGFVSRLCGQSAGAEITTATPPFMLVTLVTFVVALAGTWAAVYNWRKLVGGREEAGPVRFLAMIGLINSAGFIGAFVFSTATLVVAPLCVR